MIRKRIACLERVAGINGEDEGFSLILYDPNNRADLEAKKKQARLHNPDRVLILIPDNGRDKREENKQ